MAAQIGLDGQRGDKVGWVGKGVWGSRRSWRGVNMFKTHCRKFLNNILNNKKK